MILPSRSVRVPLLLAILGGLLAQAATPSPPAGQDDSLSTILAPEAEVVKLAGGMLFTEGPVWIPDGGGVPDGGYLLFSDVPGDEIRKWKDGVLTSFRKPSRNANGNRLDDRGRLITCEHGSRTVTRSVLGEEGIGEVETLIGEFEGFEFNSPNDLAIRSDGTIWFTDPHYGLGARERELDDNNVFCFQPATGEIFIVARDFDMPNGVCLSPDEKRLFVADSGKPRHIRGFEVAKDGSLSEGEVFARIEVGAPDGIRCDREGRLFSSAGDGVQVFAPDGDLLGKILVPESPSNLCFGGPQGTTLFMTARTSIYSVELRVAGRDWNPKERGFLAQDDGGNGD
jgi:gluconolactonase